MNQASPPWAPRTNAWKPIGVTSKRTVALPSWLRPA